MSKEAHNNNSHKLYTTNLKFVSGVLGFFFVGILTCFLLFYNSSEEILPQLVKTRNQKKPHRVPETFAENFSDSASQGTLVFNGNSSFTFNYQKSTQFDHAFVGVFFPLEDTDIDLSEFDEVIVRLETADARRIPVNLAFSTNVKTHQYIRSFIEPKNDQKEYVLPLDEFFTPEWWYDYNKVSQIDIPKINFSEVEALSFESCHLLDKGEKGAFTVSSIVLKKRIDGLVYLILAIGVFFIVVWYLYVFEVFKREKEIVRIKEKEVVHVPVAAVKIDQEKKLDDEVLLYLGQNYTNPNLTLSDLSSEFGKTSSDISKLIKAKTGQTFPKYLSLLRVTQAKSFLISGNYKTIAEIGYSVGFNSSSNFIRVFKSQEGLSPKNYAENLNS